MPDHPKDDFGSYFFNLPLGIGVFSFKSCELFFVKFYSINFDDIWHVLLSLLIFIKGTYKQCFYYIIYADDNAESKHFPFCCCRGR